MHRFFADENGIVNGMARLEAEDAAHALRVLRMQPGDRLQLFANGGAYDAEMADLTDGVTVRVLQEVKSPEPTLRVTLYQGAAKGDRMDYVMQKCTEAGVSALVPVNMPRSVAKIDANDTKKIARWQKIAREAAKQAFRPVVPAVENVLSEKELLKRLPQHQLVLVPWEDEHAGTMRQYITEGVTDLAIVIGPEGGMAENEVEAMRAAGAKAVTLGPRIFRTETAGLAAIVAAMAFSGNLE